MAFPNNTLCMFIAAFTFCYLFILCIYFTWSLAKYVKKNCICANYTAEDLCQICLASAGMQILLNVCSNYATGHSLSYNANKSYSLCFKATTIKFERHTLYFGQMSIPSVTDCRNFGITIFVKNYDLDLKRQKKRFHANTNMLLSKFVKMFI